MVQRIQRDWDYYFVMFGKHCLPIISRFVSFYFQIPPSNFLQFVEYFDNFEASSSGIIINEFFSIFFFVQSRVQVAAATKCFNALLYVCLCGRQNDRSNWSKTIKYDVPALIAFAMQKSQKKSSISLFYWYNVILSPQKLTEKMNV